MIKTFRFLRILIQSNFFWYSGDAVTEDFDVDKFFPPIELPFSITSDTERQIAQVHDPLNPAWVVQFLLDPDQLDEYTEFMPCFSIPKTENFYGIIYWQASLEGNAYFLTTFSKSGNIIDHKIIAGSLYLEDADRKSVV